MAITVVKIPIGYFFDQTLVTASVSQFATGEALFTSVGHGLTTGDHIYIKSVRTQYNGVWRVTALTGNTFFIAEYDLAPDQEYVASGNVSFQKALEPDALATSFDSVFISVHLPIVYKLQSDKWPINSVDTARTITSFSNSNGYTQVSLSGDIRASGSADALEQVQIAGHATLNGIYKILSWSSDMNFVIDLSYSSSYNFTGATIEYYYGNYHARIRIYAGLPATHYWQAYKPYELLAEIQQIPDESGVVTVNINEFIKKQIGIMENNLLLDTLPNNVDAFTYFYISFAESYDDANQYGTNNLNVSEYVGPYTDDAALVAINAVLPFKSRSYGYLEDYGGSNVAGTTAQKWLTGFSQPTLFPGKYFDVAFISNRTTTYTITRKVYDVNDNLLNTFTDVVTNMHQGVYRIPVERSAFLEKKITLQITSPYNSEILTINVDTECSPNDFYVTWLNSLGHYDYWNFTAETKYETDVIESKTQDKNIFPNWPRSFGEFADSRTKQTVRRTKDGITLNSQYLESDQMDGLALMFESPLVQEMNSIYDKRIIILERGQFNKKVDNQKLLMVTVKASFTDENPSQSL